MPSQHLPPDPEEASAMHKKQGYDTTQRMVIYRLRILSEELASSATGKKACDPDDLRVVPLIAHLKACLRLPPRADKRKRG